MISFFPTGHFDKRTASFTLIESTRAIVQPTMKFISTFGMAVSNIK